MATTLADLLDRVETVLADASNVVWSTSHLTEAIRMALNAYNLMGPPGRTGVPCTINGLASSGGTTGSSTSTTLPVTHEVLIVIGAAGYAAQTRAIRRNELLNLSPQVPGSMTVWAQVKLNEFNQLMRAAYDATRLYALITSGSPPYPTTGSSTQTSGSSAWILDEDDENIPSTS